MHRAKTFDERVDDFRNVITFLTIINIKQHFKTLEDYFKSTDNKKAYHLHIDDKKVVRRLSHTKRESLLRKLLEATKGDFTYHKHCHRTYAGGRFRLNSWFEIPESRLRELFADASNFNTATCKFLTKQQHKWIDEHVFYIETKDKDMTKAQEKEIREKEARGELAMPADYVIKQEKKKERAIEKQKISIAKKAVKATISEYAKIMAENESLKHEVESLKGEINRLKAICDSNSDIPDNDEVAEAEEPHKLSFEEFMAKYPDGIDPDTFDFDTLSDECKAKLQAERDEEQTKIDNSDIPEDDEQQIGITKEWLQSKVNEEKCSKTFAKNCWKILTDNDEDFKESRYGWSPEDSFRTKEWRLKFLCIVANNKEKWHIDDKQLAELIKICGA